VPGESPATEILEREVKKRGAPANWSILPAITDPWTNPNIKLIVSFRQGCVTRFS
jgi:hypothetical protein